MLKKKYIFLENIEYRNLIHPSPPLHPNKFLIGGRLMSKHKRLHNIGGKGKFAQTMGFIGSRYGIPLPRRFPPIAKVDKAPETAEKRQ